MVLKGILKEALITTINTTKTDQNRLKRPPRAAPGHPGGAPGGSGPVLEAPGSIIKAARLFNSIQYPLSEKVDPKFCLFVFLLFSWLILAPGPPELIRKVPLIRIACVDRPCRPPRSLKWAIYQGLLSPRECIVLANGNAPKRQQRAIEGQFKGY